MKFKQAILKLASIILIIVLSQKLVGGLYLHNWLHGSKSVFLHSQGEKAIGQYNCSCIDDFYIPFTGPATVFIEAPFTVRNVYFAIPKTSLPVVATFFQSLRGPPVS